MIFRSLLRRGFHYAQRGADSYGGCKTWRSGPRSLNLGSALAGFKLGGPRLRCPAWMVDFGGLSLVGLDSKGQSALR